MDHSYMGTAARQTGWDAATPFTPEFAMLLAAARTIPDAPQLEALAGSGMNWQALLEMAASHGVRLLVYRSLQAVCWGRLPMQAQEQWQESHASLMGKNLFLTGELLRLTQAFNAAGLRVAVMKGPVIAEMVYGDFGLREFNDIDLLVAESDVPRTIELIEQLGYARLWRLDNLRMLRFLRHMGEYKLTSEAFGTEIDLHWRIAHRSVALSPGISDFPNGLQSVSVAGSPMLSFAPEDLPLYLASQGGGDQWCDLRRICDLAEFLRRYPEVDWRPHLAAARRLGGLQSMLTGLVLAQNLLGAEPPDSTVAEIRVNATVARLAVRAVRNLQASVSAGETVSRYSFQLQAKEGIAGKLSLAWKILTDRTELDGSWIMLPRPLWWLYPLLRPVRIGARTLRS